VFEKFDLLLNYLTEDEKRPRELEILLGFPKNPREIVRLVHEAKTEKCEAETELTHLRAEVDRLKPLAEIGEAIMHGQENWDLAIYMSVTDGYSERHEQVELETVTDWYREQKGGLED
jgi:hypothetical protein